MLFPEKSLTKELEGIIGNALSVIKKLDDHNVECQKRIEAKNEEIERLKVELNDAVSSSHRATNISNKLKELFEVK